MLNNEHILLREVLRSRSEDPSAMQRILIRSALLRLIAGYEELGPQETQIAHAAMLLQEMPPDQHRHLLELGRYAPSYRDEIMELILHFKHYHGRFAHSHRVITDAKILADSTQQPCAGSFCTESGQKLFALFGCDWNRK